MKDRPRLCLWIRCSLTQVVSVPDPPRLWETMSQLTSCSVLFNNTCSPVYPWWSCSLLYPYKAYGSTFKGYNTAKKIFSYPQFTKSIIMFSVIKLFKEDLLFFREGVKGKKNFGKVSPIEFQQAYIFSCSQSTQLLYRMPPSFLGTLKKYFS